MNPIRIVRADTDDDATAALLKYLQLACLPGDTPTTLDGHWWIAYDGTRPVAFCGLRGVGDPVYAGYLCRAGVIPEYRGRGIQKRLIRVRERKAKALGWPEVISDTNLNPASANSLIACGFRTYTPEEPWGFETATYWRKPLT